MPRALFKSETNKKKRSLAMQYLKILYFIFCVQKLLVDIKAILLILLILKFVPHVFLKNFKEHLFIVKK